MENLWRSEVRGADTCQHNGTVSLTERMSQSGCRHICAGTCRHVSTPGNMPTCADRCLNVTSFSVPMIPMIWILFACWHMPAHVDMLTIILCRHVPICADMCWYGPTCANMYHQSQHLWCKPFGPYLHAGMCQHIWTCRHVLICADMSWYGPTCADMCQHIASLSAPLIPTIWTLSPCWHVSAQVDMPICADMCRHVPTYDITLGTYATNHLDMICIPVRVSTCGAGRKNKISRSICWLIANLAGSHSVYRR